jgi:putative nucleotidyltransferase with HDIG domain
MQIRLTRAFQSKVARRVALLFFACAMVPLGGLTFISSLHVRNTLDRQATDRLRDDVKAAAMWGLGQLDLFESRLRVLGAAVASGVRGPALARRSAEIFAAEPDAVVFFPDEDEPRAIRGHLARPTLTADQARFLETSGRLVIGITRTGRERHVLLVEVTGATESGVLAATLDERQLFGLDDSTTTLPAASEACVLGAQAVLGCSPNASTALARSVQLNGQAQDTRPVEDGGTSHLVHARIVPLHALYGADAWTLVMMRPQATAREPVQAFLRTSWIVAMLSGLVVTWLSLSQIRRQLRPLDELTAATGRLAARKFDQPVDLHSHDEFEDLGRAFNGLAERLRAQFQELEDFNLGTLATLARAIDAKSPWTAGHSERVTEMAVAIAKEMGLPEDELVELARGGLVHDIGKLATPAGILDKPGPLTAEEFAIMREHPKKGVHILEPIPAFRPLLPIVGQHHERWDGLGYPDRLAGTEIARTARVLAVADVFDAVGSDRPYRPGMPRHEVIEIIKQGTGTHFDPAVVSAFLRIVKTLPAPVSS